MLPFPAVRSAGTQNNATGNGDFTTFPFPAAVGGLNKKDGKADMPISDANILINIIPYSTYCAVRRGYESYATGMSGDIESLMPWGGPASIKFFAANGSSIYDISSEGPVGAADVTGLSNARFQSTNFTTSGGQFLIACNGADPIYSFDGTTWANPAITGVSPADIIYIDQWKNRLWLVEKNSTNVWYLPVNSIAGAATKLDLGPQFKLGGHLAWVGTISYDTSSGPDDLLAFGSTLGEIAVYQGTDPTSSTTFSIIQKYAIGAPLGSRPVVKVGGDLAIISVNGIISLIAAASKEQSVQVSQAAVTNKIQQLFTEYARDYGSNFGWQGQIYPRGSYVTFNIPFSSTEYRQLVMNTLTGAWCEFQNMNAVCWGLFNNDIYFGSTNGVVYKADSTAQDNGGIISFDYQGAFSNFGAKSRKKHLQMIRSLLITNGSPSIVQSMNVDFDNTEPSGTFSPTAPPASTWDSGTWDSAMWGGDTSYYQWSNVGLIGTWATPRIKGALNGITLQFNSFELKLTVGGVI